MGKTNRNQNKFAKKKKQLHKYAHVVKSEIFKQKSLAEIEMQRAKNPKAEAKKVLKPSEIVCVIFCAIQLRKFHPITSA